MAKMMRDVSVGADLIDLRDVIARFEELEDAYSTYTPEDHDEDTPRPDDWDEDEYDEFKLLRALLDKCKGNGGDEQWRGDWYPITLIRDSYFREYAEELAEDIGAISKDATWPNNFIDWDAAADALKGDYTSVDYGDETYWVR